MEKKMVSVIVPVYNSQDYLEECIDSILNQTYQNVEIILVNDGSTDKSGYICDSYVEKSERIKVIHKENEGQQAARTAGIMAARGEYIVFIDSDDWIDEDMFEKLLTAMKDSDLVTSGIYRYSQSGEIIDKWLDLLHPGTYTKDSEEFFGSLIVAKNYNDGTVIGGITNNLVNKIFKAEIIRKMYNAANVQILIEEDFLFGILYILQCNSVTVTDYCFYHYRDHSQSVMHKENLNYLTERNVFYMTILNAIKGHWMEADLKKQLQRRFVYSVIYGMNTYMDIDEDAWLPTYTIPDTAILKNKKVILVGAGVAGKNIFRQLKCDDSINLVAWIDTFLAGKVVLEQKLLEPNDILEMKYDLILCAVLRKAHFLEMKKQLIDLGVDEDCIIWQEPQNRLRDFFLH